MKKRNPNLIEWELVPETSGKITNGIYIHKDRQKLKIRFAWGDDLIFAPEEEIQEMKIKKPPKNQAK